MASPPARFNTADETRRISACCLSDALARATIRLDPFPHVVVPDALDPSLYGQLCAGFPPFARIGWADHGVSVRQPTPHFRRYVFITAELGEDWLMPA